MILNHLDAILARLRANPDLAGIVYDEKIPTGATKYVNVFVNTGFDDDPRFTGPTMRTTFTFTIHSVGGNRRQSLWVAERVREQLVNFTPTVTNRQCGRLEHPISRPVLADTSSNPPLWYAVDQFDLTSYAA